MSVILDTRRNGHLISRSWVETFAGEDVCIGDRFVMSAGLKVYHWEILEYIALADCYRCRCFEGDDVSSDASTPR